jgi:hypothetical protein
MLMGKKIPLTPKEEGDRDPGGRLLEASSVVGGDEGGARIN